MLLQIVDVICFNVIIFNFEHILNIILVLLLLPENFCLPVKSMEYRS